MKTAIYFSICTVYTFAGVHGNSTIYFVLGFLYATIAIEEWTCVHKSKTQEKGT